MNLAFNDPILQGVILICCSWLGDDTFAKRHAAQKTLKPLVLFAEPQLKLLVEHPPNYEVYRRALLLYKPQEEKARKKQLASLLASCKPVPWIHLENWDIVYNYLSQAREKIGAHGPPDWADYRLATELYCWDMLASGERLDSIYKELWNMRMEEIRWKLGRNPWWLP